MTRPSSPNTIERDVSSRGSSNDVGSARIYFLTERKSRNQVKSTKNDLRVKNPEGHADRGAFRELKRYTRCFPRAGGAICFWVICSLWESSCSSHSAKGKLPDCSTVRTVSQSSHHGEQCRVERVSVVVYTCCVDIEHPCRFSGVYAKGREG